MGNGERAIIMPSKLSYGSTGSGTEIPPDSDQIYESRSLRLAKSKLVWLNSSSNITIMKKEFS